MAELIADLKQSLQTPDVDFIKTINVDEAAKTVMITKDDLNQIKKETGRIHLPEDEEEETTYRFDDEYEDDYDDEYDDEYDEDDDEYEDDDDEYEDDDDMDPRMEKIMTIGGIVAAIIILIIIIMLAGKIFGFGLFKGDSDKKKILSRWKKLKKKLWK